MGSHSTTLELRRDTIRSGEDILNGEYGRCVDCEALGKGTSDKESGGGKDSLHDEVGELGRMQDGTTCGKSNVGFYVSAQICLHHMADLDKTRFAIITFPRYARWSRVRSGH